jgi:WD40 repeat protein
MLRTRQHPTHAALWPERSSNHRCVDRHAAMARERGPLSRSRESGGGGVFAQVWDLRRPERALLEFDPHTHWVCQVRFNPTYDRLILVRASPPSSPSPAAVSPQHSVASSVAYCSEEVRTLGADLQTAGTDHKVVLTRVTSTARDNGGGGGGGGGGAAGVAASVDEDAQLQVYTEHTDSVHGAAWSAVDPWVFATVSYDGKVCINTVPRHEKYQILL